MPTLVTADWHLSSTERDSYRHKFIRSLADRAKVRGINRTLILGDITEEKDRHNDWLVNQVVEYVTRFAELGPVMIDQGNHDYYSDRAMPFFGFLDHLQGVQWIGAPTEMDIPGLGYCLFLPHTRNYKADWKDVEFDSWDWIFAHNTFAGADVGFGQRLDGIPLEFLPKDARVIAGDVHVPQKLGCVEYVGAPYLIDFGDDYEPRVLIIDRDKLHSMPAAKTDPQKRLIEVAGLTGLLEHAEFNEGDILKVKIHLRRKDADNWPAIRDEAREFIRKRGAIAHALLPILTERIGKPVDFQHAAPKSDEEMIRDFAKHRGIDERTLKAGVKML